ncbi:Ubiquitin carboxyl-terminal hydrolase 28 [Frankliniella fusca]|uniref:Ubiquitin carboxyl-terminal hydrolase 28 n=1 Tax=Frankliniella fusca TaxID=407009 RepID=A0AAE1HTU1_9NEOP|nr:Ubiquitin carboxyl-terminal hydrolase 28 [Frankliniella fusca]
MLGASSDVKREHPRPSWWVPSREGSATDINLPLKKQKFQAKKPSRYTPGAGLVPAEAPMSSLTTFPGIPTVSQPSLPLPLPGGAAGPTARPQPAPGAPNPGEPNCTTALRSHTDLLITLDKIKK